MERQLLRYCSKCERYLKPDMFGSFVSKRAKSYWCLDCRTLDKKTNEFGVASRKVIAETTCNVCGQPTSGPLCENCIPNVEYLNCHSCKYLQLCSFRLDVRLWVLCEIPDENDLNRTQALGVRHQDYLPGLPIRIPFWSDHEQS